MQAPHENFDIDEEGTDGGVWLITKTEFGGSFDEEGGPPLDLGFFETREAAIARIGQLYENRARYDQFVAWRELQNRRAAARNDEVDAAIEALTAAGLSKLSREFDRATEFAIPSYEQWLTSPEAITYGVARVAPASAD
ncbi:hypothetical protein ACFVAJ_17100 [Agromyces sp. NPDC057679]|uniref:hypothetical protein n=1 Tax=Agromyces sp. NPDC057679 TaxID=3346207 RepID=UPI00366DA478